MACYHPIPARQEGARVQLWPPMGSEDLALPCGTCIGCRSSRATAWANRCTHEASRWKWNCFATLTYDDSHLPAEGHLDAAALRNFFKRLRKRTGTDRESIRSNRSHGIRYLACGEYGEETERPHYHALLFNCTFADAYTVGKDRYGSHVLSEVWPFGMAEFSPFTPGAAQYVAQYALKKQGAGDADKDGVWRPAPFLRMSLRPAIGKRWVEQYAEDLRKGYFTREGQKQSVPRTYLRWVEEMDPSLAEDIQFNRIRHMQGNAEKNDPERRAAAEYIHRQRKERLERNAV